LPPYDFRLFDGELAIVTLDRVEQTEVRRTGESAISRQSLLYGKLVGPFSARAVQRAAREMESVLRPVLLAATDIERPAVAESHPKLPFLQANDLPQHAGFICKLLAAYYGSDEKKDSIGRRIRNSVILLVEASRQRNGAIALALYCAAMEAVLGRKGADIANTLAGNVAALLEPDPKYRVDAEEFVKSLYDTRSRVLHGERVLSDQQGIRNARCLLYAILYAMISRGDFLARAGYPPETPDAFLTELRKSRYNEGQPMGSGPVRITGLWRNSNLPGLDQ
jgi:hypothetical protein